MSVCSWFFEMMLSVIIGLHVFDSCPSAKSIIKVLNQNFKDLFLLNYQFLLKDSILNTDTAVSVYKKYTKNLSF